jgi:hypothetical protein
MVVCYRKLSDSTHRHIVKASGDNHESSFLKLVEELPGLTPLEVMNIASRLSISLSPPVLVGLIRSQGMINQLVQKWTSWKEEK